WQTVQASIDTIKPTASISSDIGPGASANRTIHLTGEVADNLSGVSTATLQICSGWGVCGRNATSDGVGWIDVNQGAMGNLAAPRCQPGLMPDQSGEVKCNLSPNPFARMDYSLRWRAVDTAGNTAYSPVLPLTFNGVCGATPSP